MTTRDDKARSIRELGTALVGLGKRLRQLSSRDLANEELARALLAGLDDLRAVLDEIATLMPN